MANTKSTPTTHTPKRFGYIRVSTVTQNLDRQRDALIADGINGNDILSDKISGTKQSRPGLDELLNKRIRSNNGDSITVLSFDRLGRSALHVMQTIADLEERGIEIRSLKKGEDVMTGATGKFMAQIMILVAEWERNMNAERVAEARASRALRAKAGEQVAGRPRTALTAAKIKIIQDLKASKTPISVIAANQKMSRASVYRALAEGTK